MTDSLEKEAEILNKYFTDTSSQKSSKYTSIFIANFTSNCGYIKMKRIFYLSV